MDIGRVSRQLEGVVTRQCRDEVRAWLHETLTRAADTPFARPSFLAAFAGAGRRLPGTPDLLPEEKEELHQAGIAAPSAWTLADMARAALLLRAMGQAPEPAQEALVRELLRKGDNGERRAVLRMLELLPRPARFRDDAVEACRTNVQDVFEAIACENSYPARFFSDPEFNQMTLKALFTGVALRRVLGLDERRGPELARMARDYANERRVAGRTVPEDIVLITAEY